MNHELDQLNKKYFALLSDLDRYAETMSKEQFDFMKKAVYEQYEKEYELLDLQCSIEQRREFYRAARSAEELVPWRKHTFFWFWRKRKWKRNRAAELIEEWVSSDAGSRFLEEEKILGEMQQKLFPDPPPEEHGAQGTAAAPPLETPPAAAPLPLEPTLEPTLEPKPGEAEKPLEGPLEPTLEPKPGETEKPLEGLLEPTLEPKPGESGKPLEGPLEGKPETNAPKEGQGDNQ